MMRRRSHSEQSIDSPSWTKRLLSFWNVENIKVVKRVIVSVIGATVLLIGIALLILPGPAFIVIPVGLAILATEYAWARRWLRKIRGIASNVVPGRDRTAQRDSRIELCAGSLSALIKTLVSVRSPLLLNGED